MGRPRIPLLDRLKSRIKIDENGCWLWTGHIGKDGYACIGLGGGGCKHRVIHRVAYELIVGAIPEGLELDHLCRVRHCCNPEHLEAVTGTENKRRGVNVGLAGRMAVIAKRKAITHCPQGHPYDEANTYRHSRESHGEIHWGRQCRTCRAEKKRAARLSAKMAKYQPYPYIAESGVGE